MYVVYQKKKKNITDVLAGSEPKPGCPADLQELLTHFFSDKRSVIEQEALRLQGESEEVPFNSTPQSICADASADQGHCLPSCVLQTLTSCPAMT